jgi:hypothetical protein
MKLHRTHTRFPNTLLLQASAALLAAISITACSRQEAPTAVAPAETLAPATQVKRRKRRSIRSDRYSRIFCSVGE